MALWAKDRGCQGERYHPLPYHLLDVAAVAEAVWDQVLTVGERDAIGRRLNLPVDEARHWVSFLAGSHDVGKASVAFALNVETQRPRLLAAGFSAKLMGGDLPHGIVSARVLRSALHGDFDCERKDAETLALAIGGHHGVVPSRSELTPRPKAEGEGIWVSARAELIELLAQTLRVRRDQPPHVDFATAMWLAGFVSVVDWIGSNTEYFPCAALDRSQSPRYDPGYLDRSRSQARKALRELGWLTCPPAIAPSSFEETFGKEPNAMQEAVLGLEQRLDEPGLVIVEAPMGSGKTEAALWLAQRWGERLGQRGFYVALPTQATSDQMFDRVTEYLRAVYGGQNGVANVQLLHGHAALSSAFEALKKDGYRIFTPAEISSDGSGGRVAAAEWFSHRKRGLLAPFGVGTVDQALLAVLQTHHVFVRLFGLAHKTVVIDEVHAYDSYMSTLIEQLLTWLAALGSSVVLLSATLPDSRRKSLAKAYMRGARSGDGAAMERKPYPRLTVASARHGASTVTIPSKEAPKSVRIEWQPILPASGKFSLGERLQEVLEEGGTAAVICNTVRRAQRVYEQLKPFFPSVADDGRPELDLLHARYPWEERAERERRSLIRFGKPGVKVGGQDEVRRPRRAVLVATQVIEQSLDLDFDLMVTDLAPVDLILQRAGRLHRHEGRSRPSRVDRPRVWIGLPEDEPDGSLAFDPGSEKVYFPHVLLRTWLTLHERKEIKVPTNVEEMIEAVYGEDFPGELPEDLRQRWNDSLTQMQEALVEDGRQAKMRYIREPLDVEHLWELVDTARKEEAPELHPALQPLTRLTEPSVTAILLDDTPAGPALKGEPVSLEQEATAKGAAALLQRSVSLSDPRVVHTLLEADAPAGWQKSPLLRNCRAVLLGSDERCEIGKHTLRLDAELGVVVE